MFSWHSLMEILRSSSTNAFIAYSLQRIFPFLLLSADYKAFDRLWLPDVFFPTEKEASTHCVTIPNAMIRISPNGSVLYSSRWVFLRLPLLFLLIIILLKVFLPTVKAASSHCVIIPNALIRISPNGSVLYSSR